jgi:hypothetical protein
MKEIDFLQQYVDAAKEATTRTRQILLVMIISSVLVFAACWNSLEGSWVNQRLVQARNDAGNGSSIDVPLKTSYRLMWLQRIRAEQVSQIHVPFLGISFDVDDLGMLGGIAFVVLLIWVNYSLWHQSYNLKLAFDLAKGLDVKESVQTGKKSGGLLYYTYQNLAMHQVLTIPPIPATRRGGGGNDVGIWLKMSKVLYALPLIVQTFVVVHDLMTVNLAQVLSEGGTTFILITEHFFLALIVALTIICFRRWRKTYATWKSVADEI